MNKRFSSLFIPVLLIVIGIGWLLGNAGVWDFGSVFTDWWPIIFIVGGLLGLQSNPRQFTAPLIFIALGFFLILTNFDYLSENFWSYFLPAAIIFVGISQLSKRSGNPMGVAAADNNSMRVFAAFSGQERRIHSQAFSSGDVTVMFGGANIDLREAKFSQSAEIHVTAIFGGVEILVPKSITVITKGVPIFGGFKDKTHPGPDAQQTLKILGTAIFGGVSITHEKW